MFEVQRELEVSYAIILPTECSIYKRRCIIVKRRLLLYNVIYKVVFTVLFTLTIQRELDDVVMTVRQLVSSVLENESFIVESVGHLVI